MKAWTARTLGGASLLAALAGCGVVAASLGPRTTSARLVNNGEFAVRVELFLDEEQDLPREVLTEVGTQLEFTLEPGEVAAFARDCEDLQAIVINDADLLIVGQIGPEADTDVLRDGDDFGCGDTIVFTFDHSGAILDFDVSTAVERG